MNISKIINYCVSVFAIFALVITSAVLVQVPSQVSAQEDGDDQTSSSTHANEVDQISYFRDYCASFLGDDANPSVKIQQLDWNIDEFTNDYASKELMDKSIYGTLTGKPILDGSIGGKYVLKLPSDLVFDKGLGLFPLGLEHTYLSDFNWNDENLHIPPYVNETTARLIDYSNIKMKVKVGSRVLYNHYLSKSESEAVVNVPGNIATGDKFKFTVETSLPIRLYTIYRDGRTPTFITDFADLLYSKGSSTDVYIGDETESCLKAIAEDTKIDPGTPIDYQEPTQLSTGVSTFGESYSGGRQPSITTPPVDSEHNSDFSEPADSGNSNEPTDSQNPINPWDPGHDFGDDEDYRNIADPDPTNKIGRGIDLANFGVDWRDSQLKTNVAKVVDTTSPCVISIDINSASGASSAYSQYDTSDSYANSWGIGITAGYNSAYKNPSQQVGSKTKLNADGTASEVEQTTKVMSESELETLGKGGASFSFSHGFKQTEGYTRKDRFYLGKAIDKAFVTTIRFKSGYPTNDGRCINPNPNHEFTLLEKIRANASKSFIKSVIEQWSPRELVATYGDFVITEAAFGARASYNYAFHSYKTNKSTDTSTKFNAAFSGATGGVTGDSNTAYNTLAEDGEFVSDAEGGYVEPDWGRIGTSGKSPLVEWQMIVQSAPKEKVAFIGPKATTVSQPAAGFSDMGAFLYDVIDSRIISTSPNAIYPSLDECNNLSNPNEKAVCQSRAGGQMTYADYLQSYMNGNFYEKGKFYQETFGEVISGPYVKNIFVANSGYCTGGFLICSNYESITGGGKNIKSNTIQKLDNIMEQPCKKPDVVGCIKLYSNNNENLSKGAKASEGTPGSTSAGDLNVTASPVTYIGYTLTKDINQALVYIDVANNDLISSPNRAYSINYYDEIEVVDPTKWSGGFFDYLINTTGRGYISAEAWMRKDAYWPCEFSLVACAIDGPKAWITNAYKYNPEYPPTHWKNVPITGIAIETNNEKDGNGNVNSQYFPEPNEPGVSRLGSGVLTSLNRDKWIKINQNINANQTKGAKPAYIWYKTYYD